MGYSDLLVVRRRDPDAGLIRRYALCPNRVVPGDLVKLHGDPNVYEVTHTFADYLGEYTEVVTAMNPVFYVKKHWTQGNEFALTIGENGEALHEPV